MSNIGKTMGAIAVTGVLGATALLPLTAAAQTTNYYVGGDPGYGYDGYGYGLNGGLPQLFVLGTLFRGPFGNGILTPTGTTLGDLAIVNQIFGVGGFY